MKSLIIDQAAGIEDGEAVSRIVPDDWRVSVVINHDPDLPPEEIVAEPAGEGSTPRDTVSAQLDSAGWRTTEVEN